MHPSPRLVRSPAVPVGSAPPAPSGALDPRHRQGSSKALPPAASAATTATVARHAASHASILELCERGELRRAVDALTLSAEQQTQHQHQQHQAPGGVSPWLLHRVIQRCGAERNLALGRRLDNAIVKLGYGADVFLSNHVLRMYAGQGRLQEAMGVFARVPRPNSYMWSSIISAHAKHGRPAQAVQLYHEMRRREAGTAAAPPDNHVVVAALQACGRAKDVESGRQIHAHVVESGLPPDTFVGNCLLDMYAKCGRVEEARAVFDGMPAKCVVTWTSMIAGYVEHGMCQQALDLYAGMVSRERSSAAADGVLLACVLKACAGAGAVQLGRELHSQVIERGLLDGDKVVGTSLVDMYVKCGQLEEARQVFDGMAARDAVAWTAMINGYGEHGKVREALALYASMEEQGGVVRADNVTFVCLLKACASTGALQEGRQLHEHIVKRGLLQGNMEVGNGLVNMYVKCGRMDDAHAVFDGMAARDAVTWNALIHGYAEQGQQGGGPQALDLYARMERQQQDGLVNSVTLICLLKACANAGALQLGRRLHAQVVQKGLLEAAEGNNKEDPDPAVLGSCLVNMYAKCGKVDEARKVFDGLSTRDAVTWNAMISGYGANNQGRQAVACFQEMVRAGVRPVETTFTCLLGACSHEGLVQEGRQYFRAMEPQYGVTPTLEHYNCLVDLLGRAGHLDEAEEMLLHRRGSSSMDNETVVGLTALLNACKLHGDIDRGTRCFERLLELDPGTSSAYVLMGTLYAAARRWGDVDRVESLRRAAGAAKKPAVAGIELNMRVQTFVVGETDRAPEVAGKARTTGARLKDEGSHVPHTEKLVLKAAALSESDKEAELCGHAEKLALAYGLLNTPDGAPLLVTKNMRMCGDCHSATEVMSRVEKRDIVVRDAFRVHSFQAGSCSCSGRC